MPENSTLSTLLTGAIGGAIVLIIEQLYLYFKDKRASNKQKIVRFPNEERIIDGTIFTALGPGASIELMKSVLGTPNKIYKDYGRVFSNSRFEDIDSSGDLLIDEDVAEPEGDTTNSYLYRFKNADVKITSRDKETIVSLTVLNTKESVSTDTLMVPHEAGESIKFGVTRVNQEWLKDARVEYIHSMRDKSFAVSYHIGAPFYTFYTYFGYPDPDKNISATEYEPKDFIGGTIDGVCISSDDTEIYFIYNYELL